MMPFQYILLCHIFSRLSIIFTISFHCRSYLQQIIIIFKFSQYISKSLKYKHRQMLSLTSLQQNLKALLKQLKQIQQTVSQPQKRKRQNADTFLLKIPKGILLVNICKFLTMQQINYLSNTCSGLRRTIYSPIGWKVLSRLKTPYEIKVISRQSDFKTKIKKATAEASMEDNFIDYDDEKFIAQERNKFKGILLNKYTHYIKSKQRYQAHRQKVKNQRALLFKMKQQILYLDAVRNQLSNQNKTNKQKLKNLSEGFTAKIQEMDELNDSLLKERTKLQNQKQALAGKIRQYQHQIQVIKNDSQKSKQILKRLKNYLLYKQL